MAATKGLKQSILNLRKLGNSYNQISKILNCSKTTISYHLTQKTKEKVRDQTRARRLRNQLQRKCNHFQRNKPEEFRFTPDDVLKRFGTSTRCYLTGQEINLLKDWYAFDHIVPLSKGGSSTIHNLGICTQQANKAKSNIGLEEFIDLCRKVSRYKQKEI